LSVKDDARKACEQHFPKEDSERATLDHFGFPEWKDAQDRFKKAETANFDDEESVNEYAEIIKLIRTAKNKAAAAKKTWESLQEQIKKIDTKSWKKYDSNSFNQFQKIIASLESKGLDGSKIGEQCKEVTKLIEQSSSIFINGFIREKKNIKALDMILSGQNAFRQNLSIASPENEKICNELILNTPDWWIKPLQNAKELEPKFDAARYIRLIEFADAKQDDEMYFEMRKSFFKSIKTNIANSYTRIGFIEGILPGMIQRKNFDGLKEAMIDIDVMMGQPNESYAFNNAKLCGFARAMGNKDAEQAYYAIASKYDDYDVMTKWLPLAIANEPLDMDRVFAKDPYYTTHYFCAISVYLAQRGDVDACNKFAQRARKLKKYSEYEEYWLAKADALIGEFDRARLNWKKYPTKGTEKQLYSHYLLSFIIRQEFLAGEFRGFETMSSGKMNIERLRVKYDGEDWSHNISTFYFDYGRGLARYKTGLEVFQEYEKLCPKINATDLAFFMAGIATGSYDRKNPKPKPLTNTATNKDQNDTNIIVRSKNNNNIDENNVSREQTLVQTEPVQTSPQRHQKRINSNDASRAIGLGLKIYETIKQVSK
jgi:hypothetical protein